jgi:hypothetical protein
MGIRQFIVVIIIIILAVSGCHSAAQHGGGTPEFPPPILPNLIIPYTVPTSARVLLVVREGKRKIIDTLVNEIQSPGKYTRIWRPDSSLLDKSCHYTLHIGDSTKTKELDMRQFVSNQYSPNPFSPTTVIDYEVPEAAKVILVIYNIAGQAVGTLVNETLMPGDYRYVWEPDATIKSGIYFYVLQIGDLARVTRKMILMK